VAGPRSRPQARAAFSTVVGSQSHLVIITLGLMIPLTANDFDLLIVSMTMWSVRGKSGLLTIDRKRKRSLPKRSPDDATTVDTETISKQDHTLADQILTRLEANAIALTVARESLDHQIKGHGPALLAAPANAPR
jgi:hypothetical protein